ncbi:MULTISPECIES: hypothetical protein [Streptomyces]|nr:hypothetical protein [Streptomyces sp. NEAU-383]
MPNTENTMHGKSEKGTDEPPHEGRRRWWHWRRLTRGRLWLAITMAVVGALLGGVGVAWQAEAGPFADHRACWGAFDRDDVATLFDGETDIKTSELPITVNRLDTKGPSGECRLTSGRDQITVQLHQLETWPGGASDQWADEFLSARMSPLGGRLLGMASDTRAWLAVPADCYYRPVRGDGPTVIDMETGWTDYDGKVDTAARDRLAHAIVTLANHYKADQGCTSTTADRVGRMPEPGRDLEEKKDALCGIKGLPLPEAYDIGHTWVTRGEGPVRTCDRDVTYGHPTVRLMTVEDPRLAPLYERLAQEGAAQQIKADEREGHGFIRDDLGLFQARCRTGPVTFLIRSPDGRFPVYIRRLLPRYVTAEAARIGCGSLHITLPRGG